MFHVIGLSDDFFFGYDNKSLCNESEDRQVGLDQAKKSYITKEAIRTV